MSFKGASSIDEKLSAAGKELRLNPDTAEFVPFALRSPSAAVGVPDAYSSIGKFGASTLGKAVLDRSDSNNLDDEAHPDDIIPDFNVDEEEESQIINMLPFSTLSLSDVNGTSRFAASAASGFMLKEHHDISSYVENHSANFQHHPAKPWDMHGDTGNRNLDDILNEQHLENTELNPLEFLAFQFTGFAAETIADVYFANGGDLKLTIEMLTQLEVYPNFTSQIDLTTLSLSLGSSELCYIED
ncbi:polyadenylate-binding protein-interacting protein 7-like [Rutidosis leptorrhynchoides]|uniref:polyadenylate-binding protein-interacting protein 7-like n=1 Tax=Rutidosis leptorrhynchoides TaxID=125765 RepID=UPI003A9A43C6